MIIVEIYWPETNDEASVGNDENMLLCEVPQSCEGLGDKRYKLAGFVTFTAAHFTCFCYRPGNRQWWKFDNATAKAEIVPGTTQVKPTLLIYYK